MTTDTMSKAVDHMATTFDEFKGDVLERVERLEAGADRPRLAPGITREQDEYKGAFVDWMRRPHDVVTKSRLAQAVGDLSRKDVTISTSADGGYALPKQISTQIEDRVRQLNPFRGIVRVDATSSNDYRALVSTGDGAAGWVGELTSRSATGTPGLRERVPTMGEVYAYPQASNWSLEDLAFDVQRWLVSDVSAEFASLEATAIVSGSGTNQPTGILNTTPVTTTDDGSPERNHAAIQYVGLQSPGSPAAINVDSLIHLVGQVKERYLMEADACAFVMHRTTLATLRQVKASTAGIYLWGDAANGNPATLCGYPVYTCDAMPTLAADAFAVLFGNWRRGYLLADRGGMAITVDPYSAPGMTRFYVRRRVGGCVLNNDALKALRIAD